MNPTQQLREWYRRNTGLTIDPAASAQHVIEKCYAHYTTAKRCGIAVEGLPVEAIEAKAVPA